MWSPFSIGTKFPLEVSMRKKSYVRGDVPPRVIDAPLVDHLDGGVILDLPEEDATTYVKS